MAELNLKQITDKLNGQLRGESRKLVFWYDDKAEFVDDIDTIELEYAKVLKLDGSNQFYTKYFLECIDTTTHYLIYAPFPKPDIKENHLEDMWRYSFKFSTDRSTLIISDLGYPEALKPTIQKYNKFFASKERRQKFYDLELVAKTPQDIEVGIMSVLCRLKTPNYEEVLCVILTDNDFDDNPYIADFDKYELTEAFWQQADNHFGYSDNVPTLKKFTISMFVTYLSKALHCDLPQPWRPFIAYRSANNVTVYLDSLMNSYLYSERFDEISEVIYQSINADAALRNMITDDLADCGLFKGIDDILIDRLIEKLEQEDTAAKINGKTISEICDNRRRKHFGGMMAAEYYAIEYAYKLLLSGSYNPVSGINNIIQKYQETFFEVDRTYRLFYYYFDMIEDTQRFEKLRELVENVYTNDYLNKICVNWNTELIAADGKTNAPKQIDFYSRFVRQIREKTVVIISDALRYEVGYSLYQKLSEDEKCKVTITPMQSVLPSYTRLGMAALLPHTSIELTDGFEVLVDGKACHDTDHREPILRSYSPNSRCVQYDSLKNMSVAQLREVFTRQDVVYVYHNQVDARGDKLNTENEVFNACKEAIDEIHSLIRRLTTSANTSHFIVTADHGFIYKRDNIAESDKIASISGSKVYKAKRYVVAKTPVTSEGVCHLPLSEILRNDDDKIVSFPVGSDIFKAQGGGMNFVHGGSSPQEMLVPLLDVRTEKKHMETTEAQISLVSLSNKLTNLIFSLDFIQNEPVGGAVKEATYRIVFVDDDGDKISNEIIHTADNKSTETVNRVFKLRFNLRNRQYSRGNKYYLLIIDDKTDMEVMRKEVLIDIAFAGDFGF